MAKIMDAILPVYTLYFGMFVHDFGLFWRCTSLEGTLEKGCWQASRHGLGLVGGPYSGLNMFLLRVKLMIGMT